MQSLKIDWKDSNLLSQIHVGQQLPRLQHSELKIFTEQYQDLFSGLPRVPDLITHYIQTSDEQNHTPFCITSGKPCKFGCKKWWIQRSSGNLAHLMHRQLWGWRKKMVCSGCVLILPTEQEGWVWSYTYEHSWGLMAKSWRGKILFQDRLQQGILADTCGWRSTRLPLGRQIDNTSSWGCHLGWWMLEQPLCEPSRSCWREELE